MAMTKVVNGTVVEMTKAQEDEFLTRQTEDRLRIEEKEALALEEKKLHLKILRNDLSDDAIKCLRTDLIELIDT